MRKNALQMQDPTVETALRAVQKGCEILYRDGMGEQAEDLKEAIKLEIENPEEGGKIPSEEHIFEAVKAIKELRLLGAPLIGTSKEGTIEMRWSMKGMGTGLFAAYETGAGKGTLYQLPRRSKQEGTWYIDFQRTTPEKAIYAIQKAVGA